LIPLRNSSINTAAKKLNEKFLKVSSEIPEKKLYNNLSEYSFKTYVQCADEYIILAQTIDAG
jgi:hypothetical protein